MLYLSFIFNLVTSDFRQRTVTKTFKARTRFELDLQKGDVVMAQEFDETFSLVSNKDKCGFAPSIYLISTLINTLVSSFFKN